MTLPVSLADAKTHLRVTGDAQDDEINRFIVDAAGWVERYTGHILVARDVVETFSGVQSARLKAWPVAADATFTVEYDDGAGVAVPVTGGRLDVLGRPAQVRAPYGQLWPFPTIDQAYRVTVRAGYEDLADVPTNMRRAMLVLISGFDSDREGGVIFQAAEASARLLCRDYRLRRL